MLQHIHEYFNAHTFTAKAYSTLLSELKQSLGGHDIAFRVMEAPLFCSAELRNELATCAIELLQECVTPEYIAMSNAALSPEYTVPNQAEKPLFSVIDFAITLNSDSKFIPKLVEFQGFPSLFGYQQILADTMRSVYSIGNAYTEYFSDIYRDQYVELLRTALVGTHHPDEVCLLEYKPEEQKTRPDFIATKQLWNVDATDICSLQNVGGTLFHQRGNAWVPIKRVYNRAIIDELHSEGVEIPFAWNENVNVEWAGHPNWYFRMSKYALPFLKHRSVPKTHFVSKLDSIPTNLDEYVLKPLYAFAGKGVNINPTAQDIEAIPEQERSNWVLMEKIHYAECVPTPLGNNKVEIRVMCVWLPDSPQPIPTISLVRSGRGAMMGARFNSIDWTGATICFFEK